MKDGNKCTGRVFYFLWARSESAKIHSLRTPNGDIFTDLCDIHDISKEYFQNALTEPAPENEEERERIRVKQ